jgi:hypothetical protein
LGGKVEEVEKNLLLLLPLATKPSTSSFHWPPSLGSTFTYLFILFKRRTWMIGVLSSFSLRRKFPIELGETLVFTSPRGGKR